MTRAIDKRISFVGAGNMAEAFIRGVLKAGLCLASDISVSDVRRERLAHMRESFGVNAVGSNRECVNAGEIVVIAVKPQHMAEVLDGLAGVETRGKLFLSIAAGITIGRIEKAVGLNTAVIRVMPNTPALIGEGMSVWARGRYAEEKDADLARRVLSVLGKEIEVEENLMDAATALSGSGPAYVFYLMEAMVSAGEDLGFTAAQALSLAVQTVVGAGRLVELSGQRPDELREKVTSPGGTTAAAMRVLESGGVKGAFISAIRAACERSRKLNGEQI